MLGKGQAGEFRVHQLIVDLHLERPAPTLVAGDLHVRRRIQQELSQQLALHCKVAGAAVGVYRQTDTVAAWLSWSIAADELTSIQRPH